MNQLYAIFFFHSSLFLVTQNLRHLYKGRTQVMIQKINVQVGIPVPTIVTPKDFLGEKVM